MIPQETVELEYLQREAQLEEDPVRNQRLEEHGRSTLLTIKPPQPALAIRYPLVDRKVDPRLFLLIAFTKSWGFRSGECNTPSRIPIVLRLALGSLGHLHCHSWIGVSRIDPRLLNLRFLMLGLLGFHSRLMSISSRSRDMACLQLHRNIQQNHTQVHRMSTWHGHTLSQTTSLVGCHPPHNQYVQYLVNQALPTEEVKRIAMLSICPRDIIIL